MGKIPIGNIRETFAKHNLCFSRMVGGSKSGYDKEFPNHLNIFNARIYDKNTFEKHQDKKIKDWFAGQEIELWYGDLDLNNDIKLLSEVARELKMSLIVTREDGEKVIEINHPSWMGENKPQ